MSDNPNELTVENSAVVLIDHQPWVAFAIESIDRATTAARSDPNLRAAVLAQLTAGIVPAPTWATEPEPAR